MASALGRSIYSGDPPRGRAIAADAEPNGYRMSSLIMGVVLSDPFRAKKAEGEAEETVAASDGISQSRR
jgi:hypothetical protein